MNREKVIAVVGADKGMGNRIAKELAKHGFRVALIAREYWRLAKLARARSTRCIFSTSAGASRSRDAQGKASLTPAR